jgi:hypothetical protein
VQQVLLVGKYEYGHTAQLVLLQQLVQLVSTLDQAPPDIEYSENEVVEAIDLSAESMTKIRPSVLS